MKLEILSTLFYNICSAFPQADISIMDNSGNCLLYRYQTHKSKNCHTLSFKLPQNYRISMVLPADMFTDPSVPNQMINTMISLVIQDPSVFDKDNDYSAALTNLANRLLYPSEENGESISFLAASWGLDFHISRIVCVLVLSSQTFSSHRTIMAAFCRSLREYGAIGMQDLLAPLDQNKLLYCCPMPTHLKEYLSKQYAVFSHLCPTELSFGVGISASSPSEYRQAYMAALQMAESCPSGGGIRFISDYPAEYMIQTLPKERLEHFYLNQVMKLQSCPHLTGTICALIENNMDLHRTASSLYVHRNTVIFRLRQIKKILNINPLHRDSDRFILTLIYLYYKKLRKEEP